MAMPDMGKMIGPLPLGAWLAVGGGSIGIFLYMRNRAPAATIDPTLENNDAGNSDIGTGVNGNWTDMTPPDNTDNAPASIDTNEDWAKQGINWLIASGYSPNTSDMALRKYLVGEKLSAQEFVLIGLVLGKFGSPPIPMPPSQEKPPVIPSGPFHNPVHNNPGPKPQLPKPKPIPKPKPKKKLPPKPKAPSPLPRVRHYIVRPGDSLSKIAQKYYHKPDWTRIYNANRKGVMRSDRTPGMIVNPNHINPGWKLVIP
jgi:LysM domain-containing protein